LGVFDILSTLAIGKEAFLRGPAYLVKTDQGRKNVFPIPSCYPGFSGLTSGGGFMIQVLSVS
jgi:hypothetical protein